MNPSRLRRGFLSSFAASIVLVLTACGSNVQGTYSDSTGSIRLQLQSGGKALFQAMGGEQECTYSATGNKLHLRCGSDKTDFEIHEDGLLTNDSPLFPALRKTKS